jgi:alkylhydroperoxidase family enzyme
VATAFVLYSMAAVEAPTLDLAGAPCRARGHQTLHHAAHGGNVDDATFAGLSQHFSPQEIVEITMTVGSYYSTGLFTKALRIEVEQDGRLTVAGKC